VLFPFSLSNKFFPVSANAIALQLSQTLCHYAFSVLLDTERKTMAKREGKREKVTPVTNFLILLRKKIIKLKLDAGTWHDSTSRHQQVGFR